MKVTDGLFRHVSFRMMPVVFADIRTGIGPFLVGATCLLVLVACIRLNHERILYDASGMQVGISTDMSVNMEASPPVINGHPAELAPQEIRALLGSLQVSGWSGTMVGVFSTPQPHPVFTEAELAMLAAPIAAAFHAATLRERVFFVLQNPAAPYDPDRTAGSLFFRDDYLHVILTDHYTLLAADPGGGEKRDPRDTKGMKLWLARPAQAAAVSPAKEPRWNQFETVHISLKPAEVLAALKTSDAATGSASQQAPMPAPGQPALKAGSSTSRGSDSLDDLRSQIKDQAATIEKLKAELEQLRSETQPGNSKSSSERQPARKQPVQ